MIYLLQFISAALIVVSTALGFASAADVPNLPPSYLGFLIMCLGFILGYRAGVLQLKRSWESGPEPRVEREVGRLTIALRDDYPSCAIGFPFFLAMGAPVSLVLAVVALLDRAIRGEAIKWDEWFTVATCLPGFMAAIMFIGSAIFMVPNIFRRTQLVLDPDRLRIRRRGLLFRSTRDIPRGDLRDVESSDPGLLISLVNGKRVAIRSGLLKPANDRLQHLITDALSQIPPNLTSAEDPPSRAGTSASPRH